ncbi:MAG: hypothetical protein JXR83_01695 [Deltaproteobacteria bacterium]|nr:hypothetical protein [Deltaproteobacteria bacterium]
MSPQFFMHLAAACGAVAVGVVAAAQSRRSPLLHAVLACVLTIAAWNTSQGINILTGTLFWKIMSPSLAPLPLAAFATLAVRAARPPTAAWRRVEIVASAIAIGFALLTLAAFGSALLRSYVLSPRWNELWALIAFPYVAFTGWLLVSSLWFGAPAKRALRATLLVAGAIGFFGGLTEVLPPHQPLQLGALALMIAVAIAAVGVVSRGLVSETVALQEILVTLAAVAAIIATAGLVVWRSDEAPVAMAIALAGAGLVALGAYRLAARGWRLRLEDAARLAALGRATSVLAHEVRNPLTTVRGAIDILAEDVRRGTPAADIETYLTTAQREIGRVLELVEDCLAYARAPAPSIERFDLRTLIDRVVAAARLRFEQAHIEWQPPEREIAVSGDGSQLVRLVENLVVNACQVKERPAVQVEVGTAGDGQVWISVADDGPGVPDELRAQIFEPFFTTKAKGGGLGLAIAREIARRHGGDIAIERAAAGGARFVARWQQTQTG